jgi:hypothetical protein
MKSFLICGFGLGVAAKVICVLLQLCEGPKTLQELKTSIREVSA